MRANEFITEEIKQRLDPKCWTGKHKEGTKIKGGVRVNNCVPNESVAEDSFNGVDITVEKEDDEIMVRARANGRELGHVLFIEDGEYLLPQDLEVDQRFRGQGIAQTMYDYVKSLGYKIRRSGQQTDAGAGFWDKHRTAQNVWEQDVAETAAWRRKEGKSAKGGLNAKGVASYRRENPGSKLQTAVTTKPSKLKPGSKAAKRRKSFCARMSGVKGPMKKPNGKPTRKALALRKWNCESVEHMVDMIIENMDHDRDNSAVPELKSALLAKKQQLQRSTDDQVYDIIDSIMTRIARSHGISGQKLHDMWTAQYDQIPDTWIMK